jgi:23S rRNA (pseudouridine1915-N3)-methyltransferase
MVCLLAIIFASFLARTAHTWTISSFSGQQVLHFHGATNESKWTMGMAVKIRIVGRKSGSEKWLDDAYCMYEMRLRSTNLDVETIWHKNDSDLTKAITADQEKGHTIVLMDPTGTMSTSEKFSRDLFSWMELGGSRVVFVIGGANGLPSELKGQFSKSNLLSLSAMTFTHQFSRTILMEQIYRASEIRRGSGYHK